MPFPEGYKKLREEADQKDIRQRIQAKQNNLALEWLEQVAPKWVEHMNKGTGIADDTLKAFAVIAPYLIPKPKQVSEVETSGEHRVKVTFGDEE